MDDRRRAGVRAGARPASARRARPPRCRACGCAPTGRGSAAPGARGTRSACRSPPGRRACQSTAWSSTSASTSSSPIRRRVLGRVERGRQAARDDLARDALHDVERRADDRVVVADRQHPRRADRAGARARAGRAPRAARRGRWAGAAGAAGGAARPPSRRGARRRSRWSAPRRPARPRAGARRRGRGRRGRPAAARATSSGTRSFAAPSAWVRRRRRGRGRDRPCGDAPYPGTATADRPRRWGQEIMRRPLLLTLVLALVRRPGRRPRDRGGAARAVRDLRGSARARLRAREARGGLLDARVARRPLAARSSCTGRRSPRRPRAGCARPSTRPTPPPTAGAATTTRIAGAARARLGRPADALRPGAALGHPGRSGHAHPPAAPGVPRLRHRRGPPLRRPGHGRWSIWNEPNQPQFLKPQFDRRHRPVSPGLYRGLLSAAFEGFHDAGAAQAARPDGGDVAPGDARASSPR